jgi:hypothetical protein
MIWILVALLAFATLDRVPDPPAVKPGVKSCKILPEHADSRVGVGTPNLLDTVRPLTSGASRTTDEPEPYRPTDRIVLTVMAADASPPQLS